jgi:ribosomal protein S18 acetylase RimI-like enzyme
VAEPRDLGRYLDLLEGVAAWLDARGIRQWPRGTFRQSADFYAASIARQEVRLALAGDELVGTLRLLLREPIVWPEVAHDDGVYVYNLAVRRGWAGRGLGRHLLDWAGERARSLGRTHVRLDCMRDNRFLRDYYTQAGFEERGEIEAMFPAPVGLLRLQRYEKRVVTGWRLACFDLDGTLVRGISVCQHLGDRLGHGAAIRELEQAYAPGDGHEPGGCGTGRAVLSRPADRVHRAGTGIGPVHSGH